MLKPTAAGAVFHDKIIASGSFISICLTAVQLILIILSVIDSRLTEGQKAVHFQRLCEPSSFEMHAIGNRVHKGMRGIESGYGNPPNVF